MFELHTPVLLHETIEALLARPLLGEKCTKEARIFVDATTGLWGHSSHILAKLQAQDRLIAIDRDSENLQQAKKLLDDPRVTICHDSFAHLHALLETLNIRAVDGILYDLWVSSVHYDDGKRGFSVRSDGPLDMRFDQTDDTVKTAEQILSEIDERDLYRAMMDYSDEPKAFFIAKAIVGRRKEKSISTTADLLQIIETASFDKKSAPRVFQAIRILVNEEFRHIEESIPQAIEALKPGGILCIITFHSIEDRLIKNVCKKYETPETNEITGAITAPAIIKKVAKKPIEASAQEVQNNPRSRSAKLRVYRKI